MHTYYTLYRPPAPGAIPKERLYFVHSFEGRTWVPDIQRYAWGFAVYCRELTAEEIRQYELVKGEDGWKENR